MLTHLQVVAGRADLGRFLSLFLGLIMVKTIQEKKNYFGVRVSESIFLFFVMAKSVFKSNII